MIDALILDLGNVLAFHDNERLFTEMATAFRSTREVMRSKLDGGLWERVNRGQLPGDALRQELVARLGQHVSAEHWFEVWNCHFSLNVEMVSLVERLVGRIRLVLLSNTHDQHVAFLRPQLPVLERFTALVLSCEEGAIKPEERLYRRALELAQVSPGRAAFFDDVPRYAEAASSFGIRGHLFTTAWDFREQLRQLRPDLLD